MPFELQQTRYDQIVRRVGGIIGPGSKVAEALPELFPMIDVERVPGELLALGGTRIAFGSEDLTAGGGLLTTIQLFNPADSGFLITCNSVLLAIAVTGAIRWNITNTALTTLSTNSRFRDSRFSGVMRPVGQIRTDSIAGAVTRAGQLRILANTPLFLKPGNGFAILAPGTGITFQQIGADARLIVNFNWRERVALQSELSF